MSEIHRVTYEYLMISSHPLRYLTQSVCCFFYSCVVLLGALQVPAAALSCLHDLQVAVHGRHHAAGQSTRHGRR